MIDWRSMSEDEIRQQLKGAGIEPIGVEVDTSTLTVWVSGTRKDREVYLVPRKFAITLATGHCCPSVLIA